MSRFRNEGLGALFEDDTPEVEEEMEPIGTAELKRRLSKAQSDLIAARRDVITSRVVTIGIIFLGLIVAFAVDANFGILISVSGAIVLFFFQAANAKHRVVEIRIKALEGELTKTKQLESAKIQSIDRASTLLQEGGLANLQEALEIYSKYVRTDIIAIDGYDVKGVKKEIAREKEKLLDYAGAIEGFEELGLHDDAKRARRKMLDEKKVDQTVIHGDYVDDRDTIIKDSVISKSSIGTSGDDKIAKLEKIAEMKDKGIIDDAEFQQMKKEILGK